MAEVDKDQTEALNPEPKNETLDVDTILKKEVGQFGWFQIRTIILSVIVIIFAAWSNQSYVFTTSRILTRCHIPECDAAEPEFAPSWLLNTVPGTSLTDFDNCHRFASTSATPGNASTCPADLFNQSQLITCERHLYENTDTVVYDFDMGCDEWRRTLIGSIRLSGSLFTQFFTGYLSDRFGRRTALVIAAFNNAWLGVMKYFANSYVTFVAIEFGQGLLGGGCFQSTYILLVETVSPKHRVLGGAFMNTSLSVGFVLMGLLAWAIPHWRIYNLVLFVPQLITIAYFWLMSESVRWYISKGRFEDCEKTLKHMAKLNNNELSDRTVELIRKLAGEEQHKKEKIQEHGQKEKQTSLLKELFQYKTVLIRNIITPFMWGTLVLIFQGLTINAVGISGNKYLNFVAVATSQIPGFWIANYLLDKLGRKPTLIGAFWICAACQTLFIFVPEDQFVLSLVFYMVGTCCSAVMLSALYIYTAELFPTPYRHRFFAFSSMIGRLGSIVAPLTPAMGAAVWYKLPFAMFAGFAWVAGALALMLPETRGEKLPDTMQEAAELGKKKERPV